MKKRCILNLIAMIISLDLKQFNTEYGEGRWSILKPLFSTVTIHEGTLL